MILWSLYSLTDTSLITYIFVASQRKLKHNTVQLFAILISIVAITKKCVIDISMYRKSVICLVLYKYINISLMKLLLFTMSLIYRTMFLGRQRVFYWPSDYYFMITLTSHFFVVFQFIALHFRGHHFVNKLKNMLGIRWISKDQCVCGVYRNMSKQKFHYLNLSDLWSLLFTSRNNKK